MRPTLRLLDDALIERILAEARDLLDALGVEIHNPALLGRARRPRRPRGPRDARARILGGALIDRALASAPREFRLYDALGARPTTSARGHVYFTPGLGGHQHPRRRDRPDPRRPTTADYVRYAKLVSGLPHIAVAEHGLHPGRRAEQRSPTATGST